MERKWYEETCKAGLSHLERWRKGKREGEEYPDVGITESKYPSERNSSPSLEGIEEHVTISELSVVLGKESRQTEALAHVALRQIGASVELCQKHLNDHSVVVDISSQLYTLKNAMERAEEARSHLVQTALEIMQRSFSVQEKEVALEGDEVHKTKEEQDCIVTSSVSYTFQDGPHWKKKAEELSMIVEELQLELKATTEENRSLRCGDVRSPMEQDYSSPVPHGEQRPEAGIALGNEPKSNPSVSTAPGEVIEIEAGPQNLEGSCTKPLNQHTALSPSVILEEEGLSTRPLPLAIVEKKVQETALVECESYASTNPHAELPGSSTREATTETKPSKGLLHSLGRWVVGSNEPGDQGDDGSSPMVV